MATRPTPRKTLNAATAIGDHLKTWRKLLGLTSELVAERAAISRGTLSRIEHGDPKVGMEALLNVAGALGVLDSVVKATDPYETDFGRAQSEQILPQRVRR